MRSARSSQDDRRVVRRSRPACAADDARAALRRPARLRRGGRACGHGDERGRRPCREGVRPIRHVELPRLLERRRPRRLGCVRARLACGHRRARSSSRSKRSRSRARRGCGAAPRSTTRPRLSDRAPPTFALPTRPVLVIGLVGLCAVFAEQAGTDWSAIYIRDELGGSATRRPSRSRRSQSPWPRSDSSGIA